MVFNSYGYKVVGVATNGEEAINMYKSFNTKPDIIIMDYRMPIKDGLETMEEILKINENSKIIVVSADIDVKERALALGAIKFMNKPFKIDLMHRNIQKVLKIVTPLENSHY